MAAQTSFFLVEEELSCPICFEEYTLSEKNRQPKLLLCLHTFCLACMESLRKYDGTLQCSICRTSHHVYRPCDLMDNYVVFEYLRTKQEIEDEKLATHLKQEYEESLKALKEQEERDAQLAREEDEKHKQEIEKLREEGGKKKARSGKTRVREERRLEELRKQQEEEERRRLEQERDNEAPYLQIRVSHTPNDSSEERESSSDSNDSRNDDESLDSDTDDDSFQDLESAQTDDDDSPTSLVDPDDYETLSSDMDRYSTEVISSDSEPEDNVERGKPSATLPVPVPSLSENDQTNHDMSISTSPEPNLLSEEFSGVSQVKNDQKPQDTLSSLLPEVKCSERSDGTIIILDDSTDERTSDDEANQQDIHHKVIKERTLNGVSSSQNSESDKENKRYSSSEDECQVRRTGNEIDQNQSAIKSLHLQMEDENCKLQV
ncbi:hypothetical protein Anas_07628 [Armadillidium nasatum]|uniref:RING-type domain-containing protein n=1 Tax=Armadillidium nasatum TaxID=96803 RepID=A0A5N5T1S0_9CRUS|nr:hypothetical protein Anas_07628 [Armadillidium nasatum]